MSDLHDRATDAIQALSAAKGPTLRAYEDAPSITRQREWKTRFNRLGGHARALPNASTLYRDRVSKVETLKAQKLAIIEILQQMEDEKQRLDDLLAARTDHRELRREEKTRDVLESLAELVRNGVVPEGSMFTKPWWQQDLPGAEAVPDPPGGQWLGNLSVIREKLEVAGAEENAVRAKLKKEVDGAESFLADLLPHLDEVASVAA